MDSQIKFREIIDRWLARGDVEGLHYSKKEIETELERMISQEEGFLKDADRFGITSAGRVHRYTLDIILNPLLGRIRYGKRNA